MSWTESLLRWRVTRVGLGLFVPLAAALVFFAVILRQGGDGMPAAADGPLLALALFFLAQFRLLDDLADRDYDRERHPERVLVAAPSLVPFQLALALLAAINLGLALLLSPRAAIWLALLDAFFLAFYLLSRRVALPRLLHAHGVLLKYPFFVYLLAGAPATLDLDRGRLLASSWLLAAIYELAHDGELLRRRGGRWLLLGEILLLPSLWLWPLENLR